MSKSYYFIIDIFGIRRFAVILFVAVFAAVSFVFVPVCAAVADESSDAQAALAEGADPVVTALAESADQTQAALAESADPAVTLDPGNSVNNGGSAEAQNAIRSNTRTRTRGTQYYGVSLADAAATAEKMYYSGELYLFADSMIKVNYGMASIAADMKNSLQKSSQVGSRAALNAMVVKYNKISETYNSWVDVKADLEFFIDTIGARGIYSKTQLQIAYKRTLTIINEVSGMLEAARDYNENQSAATKRELSVSADQLIVSAANAVNTISPYADTALSVYRSLFDQFAAQSGLELEYKTWKNPEAGE